VLPLGGGVVAEHRHQAEPERCDFMTCHRFLTA
jgi:hypothetical protein